MRHAFILSMLAGILVSCKLAEPVLFELKPTVASNISYNSVDFKGEYLNLGFYQPEEIGFIISKDSLFQNIITKYLIKNVWGKVDNDNFNLKFNVTDGSSPIIYGKSFATFRNCTIFGNPVKVIFKQLNTPNVETKIASAITDSSAVIGGLISDTGGLTINEIGVVYNLSGNPDYFKDSKINVNDKLNFDIYFKNLLPNKTYFYKAFAINSKGISYGTELNFKTLIGLPKVQTVDASNIYSTSANFGVLILNDGGSPILEKGVLISLNPNPTFSDIQLKGSTILQNEELIASNLKVESNYYYVSYAKNEKGIAFGSIKKFTTPKINEITSINVSHKTVNGVAPRNINITYGVYTSYASGTPKMWIKQNLGAERIANSANERNVLSSGWYFQFNRKQGYESDGTYRIPELNWINYIQEDSDWLITNDPCRIELGNKWRLPTIIELSAERDSWQGEAFLSPLKISSSAYLSSDGGQLAQWGISGNYWSSTQKSPTIGNYLGGGGPSYYDRFDTKALAMPCRCISDY